jgi:membrane fusion protein
VGAPNPLFRQEAIDFQQRHRQWGEVVLLQPVSTKILAWSAVALVAAIVVFLALAQYARKETVNGYRIFVPRQGVIQTVHVTEGQEVEAGQPLLTIDTDQIAATGEDVNATMLDTLASQRKLLAEQVRAEEERIKAEEQRLTTLT